MSIRVAERLSRIPPYPFATIEKRVRDIEAQGNSVVRLDMGSPDLPPPSAIVEELYAASSKASNHGYGGFIGLHSLRTAFANYYKRRFEVDLNADTQVLPLIGSKEGIVNIALALVNPGDVILVPDLAYPAYVAGALLAGAEPFEVRLVKDDGYLPDLDSIPANILQRARLMWINYPHNPTGAVATREDLSRIVDFCRTRSILLCSDNPYADIAFGGFRPPSLLEVPGSMEIAVEFNSLSKTYNMAGWRVGVCVGNADMVNSLLTIKSNVDSGLFRPIQEAAVLALDTIGLDWLAQRNAQYERRRDIVMGTLSQIGLVADPPAAGIYVWASVLDGDDGLYAEQALNDAFVSITPGRVYGSNGRGFVRFSLVTPEDRISEAMDRMTMWYTSRRKRA